MLKDLKFKKGFFENNRTRVMNNLDDNSVVFILSSINQTKNRDTYFKFRQDSNFFYLTGLELKRSVLAMYKVQGKVYTTLFRKVLDPTLEKWIGSNTPVEYINEISGIKDIRNLNDLTDFYGNLFNSSGLTDVYLYNEYIPEMIVPSYTQTFGSNLRKRFNFIKIKQINSVIDRLRQTKDSTEIKMIRRAIDITGKGINSLIRSLKTGITENECEAVLLYNYIKYGAVQPSFLTIAASGKNATILHYEENNRKTEKNELILIDTGAEYKNYSADISRTLPVSGKFTAEQKKFYKIVLKALNEVTAAVKPGVKIRELQDLTKKILFEGLKKIKMVKEMKELSNYYYHGVSHFLGLDTHDVGIGSEPLKKNSIITVEPGLYIAEKGIGIRLENDILVTSDGYENLSASIPVEIEEIEEIMNKGK